MALVVFLRGVNVGGHRTFRPSILARDLSDYDVVNVGAAGTFVVRKPGSRAGFRAELLRKLPFETDVVLCDGRDLIRLETEHPFGTEPSRPDVVRFVSILTKAGRVLPLCRDLVDVSFCVLEALRRKRSSPIIMLHSHEHDIQPPRIRSDIRGSPRGSPQSDLVHPAEAAAASWSDHRNRKRS